MLFWAGPTLVDLLTKFGPSLSVTTWEMPPDLPILAAGVHLGTEKIENYLYRIIGVFLTWPPEMYTIFGFYR